MRLRQYLRGLGIGIAVTAVVMSVSANGKNQAMTDAQIIARAKELGMVDGVLTELPDAGETEQTESGEAAEADYAAAPESSAESPETAEESGEESGENTEEAVESTEADTETGNPAEDGGSAEQENEPQSEVEKAATVTVAVYPGEGSHTVSRKLAALGLVESADIYDNYLCQNGYDKKLCAGNYVIPEGADAEQIAKILTESN